MIFFFKFHTVADPGEGAGGLTEKGGVFFMFALYFLEQVHQTPQKIRSLHIGIKSDVFHQELHMKLHNNIICIFHIQMMIM